MKYKLFLKHNFISILFLLNFSSFGQTTIFGKTFLNNTELAAVAIWIDGTEIGTISDQDGFFTIIIQEDDVTLKTSFIGANTFTKKLNLAGIDSLELNINLSEESSLLSETVVSGNLKEVERLQSIVPVELYTTEFFRKTPSTNLFESVANINGVRLQIYFGVKNIFNYKPASNSIARSQDPFDKEVQFDNNGNAVPSANNPYGLTFDPSYAYYSMLGVRAIFGLKLYF